MASCSGRVPARVTGQGGLRKDNRWTAADARWLDNSRAYMEKRVEFHDTGKYNGGQKLMYWSMIPIIAVLLVTGTLSGHLGADAIQYRPGLIARLGIFAVLVVVGLPAFYRNMPDIA